jgi:membrane dipeptidase
MHKRITRRRFFESSSCAALGLSAAALLPRKLRAAASNNPSNYIVVEGHRDIWEFNGRFALKDKSQWSPLRDFIAPRLIDGGYSVVILPCGGDSIDERGARDPLLAGSMRTMDMLLTEVEKTNGKVSIIRTKADIPEKPNRDKVQFFLDMEGGASLADAEPEPGYNPEREMALLRQFFRLGMRGLQLTHNGRNMLGQGIGEGKMGMGLSEFGKAVIKEMNCLGMMVGVSHLSATGLLQAAEISTKPIVSTHQNVNPFLKTPVELIDEEVMAIAKTGGIVGIRYIAGVTPYKLLVDEVEYLAKKIGVEHIGVGWLGHDVGNPDPHYIPGYSKGRTFSGVEAQTMRQHWENFIGMLAERGFTEQQIGLIVGGNYIRLWKQILPDANPAPTASCNVSQSFVGSR